MSPQRIATPMHVQQQHVRSRANHASHIHRLCLVPRIYTELTSLTVPVQEYMSCFGGLSPVLSNIGHVLRLHCGIIVCAPGMAGYDVVDQPPLVGTAGMQDMVVDPSIAPLKGDFLLQIVAALFSSTPVLSRPRSRVSTSCSCH